MNMSKVVENTDAQIKKVAFLKGLILGGVLLVLNIFSFYFITTMTTSLYLIIGAPFLFAVVLPLVVSISLILELRKSIGGYWVFKQAVTGVFIMFFSAYIIQIIGRDLLFAKVIEPHMVEKTGEAIINATTQMLEKVSTNQAQIDEKIADMQKQFKEQSNQSVVTFFEGIGVTIILLFVLTLIFGAIFKKDPPLLAIDSDEESVE